MSDNKSNIYFPLTIDKAFSEEIKRRGWWKDSGFDRKLASKHKDLFSKGKLSYELKKLYLQSLGYEIATVELWEKKALPAISPSYLYIPNSYALLAYDYTLFQIRVLLAVLDQLQESIEEIMNGKSFEETQLYQTKDNLDHIELKINYSDLHVSPTKYTDVRSQIDSLSTTPMFFRNNLNEDDAWKVMPLIKPFTPPKSYSKHFKIEIDKNVLSEFVYSQAGYTTINIENAFLISNKYSLRIYLLINKWKEIGEFTISVYMLRVLFKIEDKHYNYPNFYKLVIDQAYNDLFGKYDCWFEVKEIFNPGEKDPDKLKFTIFTKI